jgi:hypothetical protein
MIIKFLSVLAINISISSFVYSAETGLGWKIVTLETMPGKYTFAVWGPYRTEAKCLERAKIIGSEKCVQVVVKPGERLQ